MPHQKISSEAEWLAIREMHIGGSEVSGLFARWKLPTGEIVVLHGYEPVPEGAQPLGSCSPYTTAYRLFLEKSGRLMPDAFVENERMKAGSHLEPAIARWAMEKWDWKLRSVRRYHTHDVVRGWGASVDYEVHGAGMDPVEIKNVDGLIFKRNWTEAEGEIVGAPLHIQLQLQHYLGARGAKQGWIVACVGGNSLIRGSFDMHGPTQLRIAEAIDAFWRGVDAGIAPVETADYDAVSDELAYGMKSLPPADLCGDREASRLARRLDRLKRHLDFADAMASNVKARLALKVGAATRAVGDGFTVTWPVIERAEKEIPARLQAAKTYRGGFTLNLKD